MARADAVLQSLSPEDFEALLRPDAEGAGDPVTTLVLVDRRTTDDARLARVLQATATDHADRLRARAVAAEAVLPRLQGWQDHRRAFDTFDFRRWPAVLVVRKGRLVTSFHPRHVFFDQKLQAREDRDQLEIFLSKMVYFDPAQVKEQKNLELEAGV